MTKFDPHGMYVAITDPEQTMRSQFDITPEQYHAGLDKLWAALGVTGPQEQDVFTLAAEAISNTRAANSFLGRRAKRNSQLEHDLHCAVQLLPDPTTLSGWGDPCAPMEVRTAIAEIVRLRRHYLRDHGAATIQEGGR